MDVLILTGMSGAGKSLAANYLEDMGYFCIDNLPPYLVPEIVASFARRVGTSDGGERVAFVIDVRSAEHLDGILPALGKLQNLGVAYRIIFLDCDDAVLISRYKQTRRNHPLARAQGIAVALQAERERLQPLKEIASDVIDTSHLDTSELRERLYQLLTVGDRDERLNVLIQSFGFKYGIPIDCDCVLDVRFIPNPFYQPEMRSLSGLDPAVREYVLSFPETNHYLQQQIEMLTDTIPFYRREGKVRLTVGVGCTGGRHRSVVLAEVLAERLEQAGLRAVIDHRDLERDLQQPADIESLYPDPSHKPAANPPAPV